MNTDDLQITAEEVRAVARHPHRASFGSAGLTILFFAAVLWLGRGEVPTVDADVPPFDALACALYAPSDVCLARVPADVLRLPNGAREVAIHAAWEPLRVERLAYERQVVAQRVPLLWWQFSVLFGTLATAVGTALVVAWAWLVPVPIAVGLHRLRVGRRELPWSDVGAADWNAIPPQLVVDGTRVSIGRMRALEPEARRALTHATDQAFSRYRTLGRLDDAALDSVRRLGR